MTLIDKAEALLPCPFCGGEDIQDWGESTWWSRPVKWMYCTECQAHGPRVMLGRGEPEDRWHHRIREEWNRRALPARGLPSVDELSNIIRKVDGQNSLGAGALAEAILSALQPVQKMHTLPAPTDAAQARPAWLSNCVVCGRIVDTREKDEGGDGHGCEYPKGWTCSSDCAETLHPDPDWMEEGLTAQAREAAAVVLDAMNDGEVWGRAVNAAMPIIDADLRQTPWASVTGVREALVAALRAIGEART